MDTNLINQYRNLNWDQLLRRQLGEAGSLEASKPWLDRLKGFLDKLTHEKVQEALPPNASIEIEGQLRAFLSFVEHQIRPYSDVAQRDQKIDEIKNTIGNILTSLEKYSVYFDVLPNETRTDTTFEKKVNEINEIRKREIKELEDLKRNLDAPGIRNASDIAEKILSKRDNIEEALKRVNEFITANETAVRTLLEKNATSFAQKAQEHVSYTKDFVPIWILKYLPFKKMEGIRQPAWYIGSVVWLWLGMLSGLVVVTIIGYFVIFGGQLDLPGVILRITALIVPSYFTVFFINQFLSQRKLFEIYKFKDIALQTMLALRPQFEARSEERKELLQRSLTVIFNEPALKEEIKYDKQLVTEILRMMQEK